MGNGGAESGESGTRLCDAWVITSNIVDKRFLTRRLEGRLHLTHWSTVLQQLSRLTPVTGKPMFGGVGFYAQGLFFALIAEDRPYFKVDDTTRPDFERLGM